MIYADDIVLIAKTQVALQGCLKTCKRHSHRKEYAFDPEKCEVTVLAYHVGSEAISSITLMNTELKYIDTFNYIGVLITAGASTSG